MTTATTTKCACSTCTCMVDLSSAIMKNGQPYCCDACANGHPDGAGCGHAGCGCDG